MVVRSLMETLMALSQMVDAFGRLITDQARRRSSRNRKGPTKTDHSHISGTCTNLSRKGAYSSRSLHDLLRTRHESDLTCWPRSFIAQQRPAPARPASSHRHHSRHTGGRETSSRSERHYRPRKRRRLRAGGQRTQNGARLCFRQPGNAARILGLRQRKHQLGCAGEL